MDDKTTSEGSGLAGLGVFVHTYKHSFDEKGRLTIPSEWREVVGIPKCVIVLPGITEPCLTVYPARDIARRTEKIRSLSISDARGRHFARTLGAMSDLVPWDAQGRIRIHEDLMKLVGPGKDVVLVGAFESFEIWSPEKWKEQPAAVTKEVLGEAAGYVGF